MVFGMIGVEHYACIDSSVAEKLVAIGSRRMPRRVAGGKPLAELVYRCVYC
jgi:hypothetical protein